MIQKYTKEETEDEVDIFLNPHIYAMDDILKNINETDNLEEKNQFIEDLTVVLLKDDILENINVQTRFTKFIDLLKNDGTYNSAVILLSDLVRHRPNIQNTFYNLDVFKFLNFTFYNTTMSFVFSICYENPEITAIWFEKYFNEERDGKNDLIKLL